MAANSPPIVRLSAETRETMAEIGAALARVGGPEYLPRHLRDRLAVCMAGDLIRLESDGPVDQDGELVFLAGPSPLALTLLAELRMRVA